jgi:hypothetical protein
MPKPTRIQKPIDMGRKALEDYERAQAFRGSRARGDIAHDLRRAAEAKGWTITEKEKR